MKLYKNITSEPGGPPIYQEVDPAELDKMNLSALRVLGELKSIYRQLKDKGVRDISIGLLLDRIARLESAAGLKAESRRSEPCTVRYRAEAEIRAAWDAFCDLVTKDKDNPKVLYTPEQVLENMEKILKAQKQGETA